MITSPNELDVGYNASCNWSSTTVEQRLDAPTRGCWEGKMKWRVMAELGGAEGCPKVARV